MMQPGVQEHIDRWSGKALAWKMLGAGGGGHLALVMESIPEDDSVIPHKDTPPGNLTSIPLTFCKWPKFQQLCKNNGYGIHKTQYRPAPPRLEKQSSPQALATAWSKTGWEIRIRIIPLYALERLNQYLQR